ncbi:putative reverse transcriptase zinc-binding domain-containing protein [Helianthus annuus]|nr:putative reverse transcriptase zinc-binding domain-containing protein [Helianthus annuus]
MGIGVPDSVVTDMAAVVGCLEDRIPFVYLGITGITVGANMNRIANWRPIFDIFESRLSLWKASILSLGGRVTLIKSVLECLPCYFFSLYKVPVGVVNKLEVIIRKFLWGGTGRDRKLNWVSWDRVSSPIDRGGLGIRNLLSINNALLLKWAWRFKNEKDNLWVKVISAIHGHRRSWEFLPIKASLGGVWGNIVKVASSPITAGDRFRNFIRGEIGNGADVAFWLDQWLVKEPLKCCYPNLFRLELDKRCVVRDRIVRPVSNPEAKWQWSRPPSSSAELAEWLDLNVKLRNVVLSDVKDKRLWMGDDSGVFSVGSINKSFDMNKDFSNRYVWEWCKWIPLKCNLFEWRAEQERLPTRVELSKRNVSVPEVTCPLCTSGDETVSHMFTSCEFATAVWLKVSRWCNTPFPMAFSIRDILEGHEYSGLKGKALNAYKGILLITC